MLGRRLAWLVHRDLRQGGERRSAWSYSDASPPKQRLAEVSAACSASAGVLRAQGVLHVVKTRLALDAQQLDVKDQGGSGPNLRRSAP